MGEHDLGRAFLHRELEFRAEHHAGARYVLNNGRFFAPSAGLHDVRRGTRKQCFMNAACLVLERFDDQGEEWLYCEGWALSVAGGAAVQHAWVTAPGMEDALEVTWKKPGLVYFGVSIDHRTIVQLMRELLVYGPYVDELVARSSDTGV